MVMLSTGDVSAIANISDIRLRKWLDKGLVKSARCRQGGGHHNQFNDRQCLAIAFGIMLLDNGFKLSVVSNAMLGICAMKTEVLLEYFENGNTHMMPTADSFTMFDGSINRDFDHLNLKKLYHRLQVSIEAMQELLLKEDEIKRKGRKRGLAK